MEIKYIKLLGAARIFHNHDHLPYTIMEIKYIKLLGAARIFHNHDHLVFDVLLGDN